MKTETVHFKITGEFLTEHARGLVLSEDPAAAWRTLTGRADGRGAETAAIAVLKGESRLTGDSEAGLKLDDEEPETRDAYLEELRFVYAGRMRYWSYWFRPVAQVTSWGPEDARHALGKNGLRRAVRFWTDDKVIRSDLYVHDGEKLFVVADGRHFVFEKCSEPPFWWPNPLKDPSAAVAECEAVGRSVEDRGWNYSEHALELAQEREGAENREGVNKAEDERRRARWAEDEENDKLKEEQRQGRLKEYRAKILEQAAGDLFELKWAGGSAMVPSAPFMRWAIGRTSLRKLAPPWTEVCPSGMKLPMDDPAHTDWMVGAGLDPCSDENYGLNSPIQQAARDKMYEAQESLSKSDCFVLSAGPYACGPAVHAKKGARSPIGSIAVLPNLHPDYLESIADCAAVVTEEGGGMAHLAQVGREHGLTIVRVAGALKRYPEGTKLMVDAETHSVEIRYEYR